jgi:hypothetical protein
MTVSLDHVTRSVDGIATIRDVSLTLERGTRQLPSRKTKHTKRRHLEPRTSMLTLRLKIWPTVIASLFLIYFAGGSCFAAPWLQFLP